MLKDEVASHDRDMESLREQYSTDMEKLRSSMEQVSQVHARTHTYTHTPLEMLRAAWSYTHINIWA